MYFQLTIQGYSLPWRSQSHKGLVLLITLHLSQGKERRRLVLSSFSAFHTIQHPSQQIVPPTVCSTYHASFNLIKKPHRHAQKLISLVALDPLRSLATEPSASLPFLISTGSLHSLSHPPALWFLCQNMTLSATYFPLYGDKLLFLALTCLLPS